MANQKECKNQLAASDYRVLLEPSSLPFSAIPFDRIRTEHFRPAFDEALAAAQERFEKLRQDPSAPTFANTMEVLESLGDPLDQVGAVFGHYKSAKTDADIEALAKEINPKLTAFSNQISLDPKIFQRVETLYQQKASLGLSAEQAKLLEDSYLGFVRRGARLSPEKKAQVAQIDEQLSVLTEEYKGNSLKATNEYELVVDNAARLKGLPPNAVKAAEALATAKGKPGKWIFTLQYPSYLPVLQYADDRGLREEIWRAFNTKATSGSNDNRPVLLKIAKLRAERAQLLGYATHAHLKTEDRMAENPENVTRFLERLVSVYQPAAKKDLAELKAFAGIELKPWDTTYYSEKLREQKYAYNEEELRPYFALENAIKGAFFSASRLYGVQFKQRTDIPTWDNHVRTYEVLDRNGAHLALFYLDPFPRESKRMGAWMDSIREAGEYEGSDRRPHVINVGNFTPPVEGAPALLTLDEVRTIFHELGHGLHGMLTKVHYRSQAGTNVAWDFVELPSQFFENWALQSEVLDVYALHHQTGERIPDVLVKKVLDAENFQAGMIGLRQITLGMIDFGWHAKDLSSVNTPEEVLAWEDKIVGPYRLLPYEGGMTSTSFDHIFSGGYSAGYYSYKWADVLACDAFSVFDKAGVFDKATADRFREAILERGGTEEPAQLYRRFRGGDPDPDALLRKEGLIQ